MGTFGLVPPHEGGTSGEGKRMAASTVDVEAVAQAFHDGVKNQDATALGNLYHDDAKFLAPKYARVRRPPGYSSGHADASRRGSAFVGPGDDRDPGRGGRHH